MSKPLQRIIQGLLRMHFNAHSKTQLAFAPKSWIHNAPGYSTFFSDGSSNSATRASKILGFIPQFQELSPQKDSCRNYSSGNVKLNDMLVKSMGFEKLLFNPLRIRQFSTNASSFGRKVTASNVNSNMAKKVVGKPLSVVTSTLSRYKEAMELRIEGFWKRNHLFMVGAGGLLVCILLWRIMFGIASTFVGLSEGMAEYGFLALSSHIVAFSGLYLHSRHTINPDKDGGEQLNTDAGILEVLGAPLAGTDLRANVITRLCEKRTSDVMVNKSKGKYDMKLLAVDIPMASGRDQRYLIGNEEVYRLGDGLIAELRDPVVKAMAVTKELEETDDIEAEEEAK
ncbi:LOW QUALITY PROTEIN: hypothetical protein Cgig2_032342 [Carnegiea gigantea]|uniref:Uncharacterized protein n=1 Tax=Carnegiea gigantea TaxID=171969 RepID=A0A9Q1GWS1_9CARY|nr:LOW QUALITY PROTEIN: hypothetical protein Cgig2_032342 [Carnegiea gigantea]